MKRICLALLFISALLLPMGALAAKNDANTDQIYGVRYGGGTVPAINDRWLGLTVDSTDATFYIDTHLQKGNYSKASIGKAFVTRVLKKHPENVSSFVIPASAIKSITLSQDKHHRVGTGIALSVVSFGAGIPVMFTKSTKDYIELTWDDNGKKGAAEFQADKKDYRGLLTALSGASGVPVTAAVDTQGKK